MAKWSNNAIPILEARYLLKDKKGVVIETPDQMLERVAKHISNAEKTNELKNYWYDKFMSIMDTLEFLPNSPTLMNSGKELGQLSACLSGNTIIRTCAGDFTIKELAEKYKDKPNEKFDVFCAASFSELGIGKAFNPRLTRKNEEVFLIKFDDGSELKATKDHLIMHRNGKFSRVDELSVGQSIMPLNYDYNHKVVSIEYCGREDVYDLSVDKYHNFAANNIFVHNCFLLPMEDNLSNIFEQVKQTALIHKSGGGTGLLFSNIRPANSMVASTSGVASGPVSFMRVFDTATDVVKQGGVRRGANMGILHCSHPDIFNFIRCKEDISQFSNFNMSVGITDNFLKAVKQRNGYPLINPRTKEKIYIKAERLWEAICTQAWKTGEPGLIFLDSINAKNPTPWLGNIEGTNPCLSGDTLIAIADGRGAISIKQLAEEGKDVPVYCSDNGKTKIRILRNPRVTGYSQKIYKITLDDGNSLRVTGNHKFILSDGTKKEAEKLQNGDSLNILIKKKAKFNEILAHSNSISQDYIWIKNSNEKTFNLEHRLIANYGFGKIGYKSIVHHKDRNGLNNALENLDLAIKERSQQKLEECKNKTDLRCYLNNNIVMVEKKCERCGINFSVKWAKREVSYCSHKCWNNKLAEQRKGIPKELFVYSNHKVIYVTEDGYEDVYNGTVDDFHNYYIGGFENGKEQIFINTMQCGEQPLLPYESCNLGSIDIAKFIKGNKIDWDKLAVVVAIAARFLDDVIDVNKFPTIKIERKTKMTRKVGLGIMGWADALIEMGIRYDSEEAIKLAKRLMMNIREVAHMTSRDLGKEKGLGALEQLKRRNATLTTIAPTGTLSVLANTSSSIEPLFAREYTKTVLNGVKLDLSKKYTEEQEMAVVTSHELTIEQHINMQAAFQQYTDNAVSKTINLHNNATLEHINDAYLLAHSLGCKGITVYRDGSRDAPLKATNDGHLSECDGGKCSI